MAEIKVEPEVALLWAVETIKKLQEQVRKMDERIDDLDYRLRGIMLDD